MATIKRYEELEIWKKARILCQNIFQIIHTDNFQKDRKLLDQINASSGSVMDNIAEGFERDSKNEFRQFLSIAKGSCGEVRSPLYRAFDRKYLSDEKFEELRSFSEEISKQLSALITYLNKSDIKGIKYKT
ncbi:MAG: four helix bundle protein [Bacteroidia bacterium]